MPLFVNRDQIFAHQVHLLEHELRSKEERILELETENTILHLRLAECIGKLHQSRVKDDRDLKCDTQKITRSSLTKLLSVVQGLKHELSEIFGVYVTFASELEEQSKILLDKVSKACAGDEAQNLQARLSALERSLEDERERCKVEWQRRKELHNTLVELRGNVRVHCRVRPVLPLDHLQTSTSGSAHAPVEEVVWAVGDDTVMVSCVKTPDKIFEFEKVHAPDVSQEDVFEDVKPLLRSLLDGYNVCVMAYGQTGSGKTHTMLGSEPLESLSEAQQGVVPKATAELFRLISEAATESLAVELSVMEVYNNEVFDLLSRDEKGSVGQRRDVVTTSSGESQVPGLTHEPVNTAAEAMHFVNNVLKLRAHSPNLIHTDSSRSHLVVTLTVSSKSPNALALARRLQRAKNAALSSSRKQFWSPQCRRANPPDELLLSPAPSPRCSPSPRPSRTPSPSPRHSSSPDTFRAKLQLVDLAGSECVGPSGVSGPGLWEVSCINRSLCALSDVLGALAEHRAHIPYRNSKLTHLLQDAIGGDAKLLLLLCVSPTQHFLTETLHSLSLGSRARQVQKSVPRRKSNTLQV
ncbi:kinesin-like protein KIF25 [Eucyclogobius newberryi]|uniref:kinesin-like protein KIF25 n=1 Tax=Eucyclogobius newberryi TaxID=166745 RepID=UPI003B5AFDCF